MKQGFTTTSPTQNSNEDNGKNRREKDHRNYIAIYAILIISYETISISIKKLLPRLMSNSEKYQYP